MREFIDGDIVPISTLLDCVGVKLNDAFDDYEDQIIRETGIYIFLTIVGNVPVISKRLNTLPDLKMTQICSSSHNLYSGISKLIFWVSTFEIVSTRKILQR